MDSREQNGSRHEAGTLMGPEGTDGRLVASMVSPDMSVDTDALITAAPDAASQDQDRQGRRQRTWTVIYPYQPSDGHLEGDALEQLLAETRAYLSPQDLAKIERAYELANRAHMGVRRRSGEPYIQHPLAVALILTQMRIDADGIVAALLHDVVEDSDYTLEEVRAQFGPAVATIVDGVTKFDALAGKPGSGSPSGSGSRTPAPESERAEEAVRDLKSRLRSETVRKMLLAMAEDPRVVVIKLADRLHNMRTLSAMPPTKQQIIARETSEIYAPLARRLGMGLVQAELEDLAFYYLEPERYERLAREVEEERRKRQPYVDAVCSAIEEEMRRAEIHAEVLAWQKHLASINRKLLQSGGEVSQLHDLVSFRILVDSDHDCYLALGHIHALWRPKDGRIKDYIATPKVNGYQSLHTTVFCLDDRLAEIQIRTHEMQRTADYGIASYWYLRERGGSRLSYREMIAWIEQLREWQRELPQSADDFIEAVKGDIFQEQIFVFTPKGEIKDLPRGSTPVDMAYRIHTDIGDHCAGARIITSLGDSERLVTRLVPLDYELKSGEIVDIVTNQAIHPTRDWLTFVRTANARTKIKRYLKNHEREINLQLGRERLDLALKAAGAVGLEALRDEELLPLASARKYQSVEALYVALGRGDLPIEDLVEQLLPVLRERGALRQAEATAGSSDSEGLPVVAGPALNGHRLPAPGAAAQTNERPPAPGVATRLAHCCCPLPGDTIAGFLSPNKGLIVHRQDCRTLQRFRERVKGRIFALDWSQVKTQSYLAPITIVARDRAGLLRDVAAVVSDAGINMTAVSSTTNPALQKAVITATMEIQSVDQIERVFKRLLQVKSVVSVRRNLGHRAGQSGRVNSRAGAESTLSEPLS
ncbi:MAG: bifunctional (p)ppGpp synthetase/guanosine-3',5'-bis(diphosphate) 3'-pyrophosphohydrolase [Thermogemmatispora sp.]|uniref:RelA/SpoT family protein n=1 Tax=Thermogemmatispora sp. TaxID=1968838 RepID=UPI002628C5EB|nr:bifunctional (p)ppGpp synthetase/guanosine-3',5'-bis(diphosphate) 3'-pyrophosphohydrolase [Thermogemmatispora sp.]MBX5455472.1 bifunctional (p)ppGpp synthetase/guanosine-3',5'-bis(diphosphate) 3'-pyrophosphohydrolase [Thermogemmatispora sp.]